MKSSLAPVFIAACLSAVSAAPAAAADSAEGIWRLNDGRVTVRINPCGPKLCGFVVGLGQPLDKKGRPKIDHENPNPALRSRPVMGLQVLFNLRAKGSDSWAGTIYNADDGGTYSASLKLRSGNSMQLRACLGPFCKTKMFVRVN